MKNAKVYWNYVDGQIETTLENINSENIKYNYSYFYRTSAYLGSENDGYSGYSLDEYNIYTSYNNSEINLYTAYGMNQALYEYMMQNKTAPIYGIILSLILLAIIAVYLFLSIGHKEGKEEIDFSVFHIIHFLLIIFTFYVGIHYIGCFIYYNIIYIIRYSCINSAIFSIV